MSDIQRFYVVAVTVSKSNLINFERSFLHSKTHITSVTCQVQWLHSDWTVTVWSLLTTAAAARWLHSKWSALLSPCCYTIYMHPTNGILFLPLFGHQTKVQLKHHAMLLQKLLNYFVLLRISPSCVMSLKRTYNSWCELSAGVRNSGFFFKVFHM